MPIYSTPPAEPALYPAPCALYPTPTHLGPVAWRGALWARLRDRLGQLRFRGVVRPVTLIITCAHWNHCISDHKLIH